MYYGVVCSEQQKATKSFNICFFIVFICYMLYAIQVIQYSEYNWAIKLNEYADKIYDTYKV